MGTKNELERAESLFCWPQEIRMVISNQNLLSNFIYWKVVEVVCRKCSLRKLYLNFLCILREQLKIHLAVLLKSLSVMDDFLEIFQELK